MGNPFGCSQRSFDSGSRKTRVEKEGKYTEWRRQAPVSVTHFSEAPHTYRGQPHTWPSSVNPERKESQGSRHVLFMIGLQGQETSPTANPPPIRPVSETKRCWMDSTWPSLQQGEKKLGRNEWRSTYYVKRWYPTGRLFLTFPTGKWTGKLCTEVIRAHEPIHSAVSFGRCVLFKRF